MAKFKLKRLVSGGLITNYFCVSSCRHCLYNCSPHWEKNYIRPQIAEENLHTIRRLGCASVHIGGGEPLLRSEALGDVLQIAKKIGVVVEYVETNSSWFKDPERAMAILSTLRKQGLQTLLVSISPFHNEFIPFDRIQGVIEAAQQAEIGIFPWISDFIADLSQLDAADTHSLEEFEERFGRDYLKRLLQRYWIHMGGRALQTYRPYLAKKSAQEICDENGGGCAVLYGVGAKAGAEAGVEEDQLGLGQLADLGGGGQVDPFVFIQCHGVQRQVVSLHVHGEVHDVIGVAHSIIDVV